MASMKTTFLLALIFLLLQTEIISLEAIWSNSSAGNSTVGCIDMEREALLKFKEGLDDPSRTLSSWVGEDCCNWLGVGCSNRTGNIIKLDLSRTFFCDPYSDIASTECRKHLPLGGVLSPSLLELKFLNYLDLSYNNFQGIPIPNFIGSLNKLTYLNLSSTSLEGMIPPQIGNLSNLLYLDLSSTSLEGTIPPQIGNLSNLLYLNLSYTSFFGTIPSQIGNLSNLLYLDLCLTSLTASNINWLSGLSSLKYLNLYLVDLSEATTDWLQTVNLLPSLLELHLSECFLHLSFPSVNLTSISVLDLSHNDFNSSSIPQWVFNLTSLTNLQLNECNLTGSIPKIGKGNLCKLQTLDLSENNLSGEITEFFQALSECSSSSLEELYLGENQLIGNIPHSLGNLKRLRVLQLHSNAVSGSIPSSIQNLSRLRELQLYRNAFSGSIPSSIQNLSCLEILSLYDNKMNGTIPESIGQLSELRELHLSGNYWQGKSLSTLDLGENRLSGTIPKWIGERLSSIRILSLRGNMLFGKIPKQLCGATYIHVLDLAQNNFSGSIPSCFGSLAGYKYFYGNIYADITEHMDLVVKGRQYEYYNQISNVNLMDFSKNSLSGEIPTELTNLILLNSLNLSWNHLTGMIPENIGALRQLESFDLSSNHLSGHIPSSMSSMTFLSHLNLSYNNLSGQIPSSNQFQTFNDPSIYVGNPELYWPPPLPTSVSMPSDRNAEHKDREDVHVHTDGEDQFEKLWFYLSIALGFIVGFWTVCGSLLIKKSWRHAYFCFADKVKEKLLVVIAMKMVCLQRKIQAGSH